MRTSEPLLLLPAFCGVDREEAALLLRHTDLLRLPVGQSVLVAPGAAQEVLVVVQGALQALGRFTWTAAVGDVLGAHALLSRTEQPYGFRASEPSLVAYVGVQQARTLMSGSPAFATAVAVALSAELGRTAGAAASR